MEQLANCLEATISTNTESRKAAEKYLLEIEKNNGFASGIFMIIMGNYSTEIKVASAVNFKNYIKRNWKVDESNDDCISLNDREFIKSNIIELMLNNVPIIQNQLSEAVSIIGKNDFPENWKTLLPLLISKIKEGNFNIINGVLRTCNSLFKRYRFESKSDELWLEIKEVIGQMGNPLLDLTQQTMTLIERHANDKSALLILWNSILLIEKIFLSLNHQDLPEFFEDTMNIWMDQFHRILLVNNPTLNSVIKDEAGILEQVKSVICDIISLYARNYDEEFSNYISVFIQDILQVLLSTNSDQKYDSLVANSLHFLSLVADRAHHRDLFVEKINLQQLSRDIIIPNIEFHESDEELFIDNPDEYIRRDIEGSHSETRRKSACELVKSLCRLFEQEVVNHFVGYIRELLNQYSANNALNWKMKDSALFLITSVASKGETGKHGVTSTTEFVDIKEFYKMHILPELQGTMSGNEVIKADCIKYVLTFRSIIQPEDLRLSINLLINFTNHPVHVVHSYAAAAINKLLMVKDPSSNLPVISAQHIANPTTFLTTLCAAMSIPGSEDNIYVMQAVMRTLSLLQEKSFDCMTHLVDFLQKKLSLVVKNPRKPLFNHSLFETIGLCIRIVCGKNKQFVTTFESMLSPIFNDILRDDLEESIPYTFQLLSLMLDQHPADQVTNYYQELFPFLLHSALWDRLGNIPSLIRLLISYLEKANWSIIADKLQNLISIFQKLNKSRALDSFGFSLITAIILYVPRQHTEPFLRTIFESIFHRLTQNKTPKYLRGFLLFFNSLVLIYPPSDVIQLINKIQHNLFLMTLESTIVPTMIKMDSRTERKICIVGITRLISESEEIFAGNYSSFWPILLTKIVDSLSTYSDESDPTNQQEIDNMHFVDIESISTVTSHNQLVFVGKKIVDPAVAISDPRIYLGTNLKKLSNLDPNRFLALYNSIDGGVASALTQILHSVGVSI